MLNIPTLTVPGPAFSSRLSYTRQRSILLSAILYRVLDTRQRVILPSVLVCQVQHSAKLILASVQFLALGKETYTCVSSSVPLEKKKNHTHEGYLHVLLKS